MTPTQDPDAFATPDEINEARSTYGSDEIEIDDGALASRGEGGLWVQAWVWLPREELTRPDWGTT